MAALEGKGALVTGAAGGIGLAIARGLAAEGARVTLADVDVERGRDEAAQIAGARFVVADMTDPEACRRLVSDTIATAGSLDVLVNNAGIQHVAPIQDFPEAKWRQILEIMLTAPFLLTQAALPGMYAHGWGRILNIGSVHSITASAYKSAYVAAKHGLLGLTRVTALEGAEHGVTCKQIPATVVQHP